MKWQFRQVEDVNGVAVALGLTDILIVSNNFAIARRNSNKKWEDYVFVPWGALITMFGVHTLIIFIDVAVLFFHDSMHLGNKIQVVLERIAIPIP